jgi:hypothetical protein
VLAEAAGIRQAQHIYSSQNSLDDIQAIWLSDIASERSNSYGLGVAFEPTPSGG